MEETPWRKGKGDGEGWKIRNGEKLEQWEARISSTCAITKGRDNMYIESAVYVYAGHRHIDVIPKEREGGGAGRREAREERERGEL